MSNQLRVGRKIIFNGAADQGYAMGYQANVDGKFNLAMVTFYDDFMGDLLADEWQPTVNLGGVCAINAAANGTVRLTSNTADDDKAELALGLNWYAQQACCMEARIKVDNITTVGINVGFSDAVAEADDQVAFEISAATIVDRCSDGVAFVFDTDATTDVWYMCNTKAGTQAGTAITGVAPVNATYEVFRIDLDTSGNATFWRNGVCVGAKAAAVTTTTALTPYIAVISRAGSASRNLDVDYVKAWQLRAESSSVVW